jgi:acetyl-CoA carboxylase carboxyl transferase subunit alpha
MPRSWPVSASSRAHDRAHRAIQKGRDIKERSKRNFGMAYPEGYRKSMRVMELADRHRFPVVTLVDTPGAYPGIAAEQHGQGGAIARSQARMARLRVPTVACVIGEGGSGGAVAIALADRVLMQENAIYSSSRRRAAPRSSGATPGEAQGGARVQAGRAPLLELGVIDGIVPEPMAGARNPDEAPAARAASRRLEDSRDVPRTAQGRGGEVPFDGRALPVDQAFHSSTGFSLSESL